MKTCNSLLMLCLAGVVLLVHVFGLYYLLHSHEQLLSAFESYSGCFYRKDLFAISMFTPQTKIVGNTLVFSAMLLCIPWSYLVYRQYSVVSLGQSILSLKDFIRRNYWYLVALVVWAFLLWYIALSSSVLCSDEAFSALNFARQPLLHLVAYYPLPNNHIFFNVLNHWMAFVFEDLVFCGRVLSCIFFLLLLLSNFKFWSAKLPHPMLALLLCMAISVQFFTWGFAAQARGYALCYLLQWWSFVLCYRYLFEGNNRSDLLLLSIVNFLGLWTIPSFLYSIIFALLLFVLWAMKQGRFAMPFLWAHTSAMFVAFLAYLPVICYSGAGALFGNKHVVEKAASLDIFAAFGAYVQSDLYLYAFGELSPVWTLLVFCLPAALFFVRFNTFPHLRFFIACMYLVWIPVLLILWQSGKLPIARVLGFQFFLTYVVLVYLLFCLLGKIIRSPRAWISLSAIAVFCLLIFWFNFRQKWSATHLYGQNVPEFYAALVSVPLVFDVKERVFVSDESFMWFYLLPQNAAIDLYDCSFNHQKYLLLSEDDRPSVGLDLARYKVKEKRGWFTLFVRLD